MSGFIQRDIEDAVATVTPHQAVVIIGPRRCGKTTLLKHIAKKFSEPSSFYSCDIPADRNKIRFETRNDVESFLRLSPNIVIDEAQLVPNIGLMLKLLVDVNETREKPSRIFVTGSSALELADGVKESAVGRIVERRIWPFSVKEIAADRSWGYVQENLSNFMIYGTYPAVVQNFEDAPSTLEGYTEALLFKDLFRLTDIRRSSKFVDLVSTLCYRIGSEINFDSLSRDLGLNKETVQRYITLLELCSIIKVVPSFFRNLDNELKKGKKIYFTDLGIRNALISDFSPLSTRSDAGAIWENFFFMERVKMHDTLRDRKRMFFWRTKANTPNELDFIEVRDRTMEAFECKLSPKAQAKPGEAFHRAYPDCMIHVVTPENCLQYFGF